ncbi:hypothetical protein GGR55DRAFT_673013 [Xylaria sp. FL0064]|nr:hypothetical protein GGR55DRAFT_673013 [Xylaria sp. FL0064]
MAGQFEDSPVKSALALHFGRQVLRLANQVTLYTHGNNVISKELEIIIASGCAPMAVKSRRIAKLVKAQERSRVVLHFEDGTTTTEVFLAHKPKFGLRGDLHRQLGLEVSAAGTVVVSPPFNQTTVKGVFAAGDCASPMQTVTQALHSGTCAGGSAPLQIQAETWDQKSLV